MKNESWIVLQIRYKFSPLSTDGSRNCIVDTKLMTDGKGKSLIFSSFQDAEDYVTKNATVLNCSYRYINLEEEK